MCGYPGGQLGAIIINSLYNRTFLSTFLSQMIPLSCTHQITFTICVIHSIVQYLNDLSELLKGNNLSLSVSKPINID